jgi:hypothetical protein
MYCTQTCATAPVPSTSTDTQGQPRLVTAKAVRFVFGARLSSLSTATGQFPLALAQPSSPFSLLFRHIDGAYGPDAEPPALGFSQVQTLGERVGAPFDRVGQ